MSKYQCLRALVGAQDAGGGSKNDGSPSKGTGSALSGERNGGRMDEAETDTYLVNVGY